METVLKKLRKKGSVFEIPFIIIFLMGASIMFIFAYQIGDELNVDWQNDTGMHNQSKEIVGNFVTGYPAWFNGLFLLVFVFLVIGVVIGASVIDTHPAMFFVALVLLLIFLGVAATAANIYDDFASDEDMVGYTEQFTVIEFVMQNFVKIIAGMGFIILGVMYAKAKGRSGVG